MARSRTPKFDTSEVITNEIIRIIERGVLPWRKPWTAGGSTKPLRVGGEPYQGVNNFLLTMRTVMAGHSSPFWMTLPQANALDAKVRKGEKSSVVVYYGQSRKDADGEDDRSEGDDRSEEARIFRFQKSYRVFNACQIEGLPESFLNRAGFTGGRFVQMLRSFLILVQAFIECLLCFLGWDVADGTVQSF
jgi:antirestriction protein ArdC